MTVTTLFGAPAARTPRMADASSKTGANNVEKRPELGASGTPMAMTESTMIQSLIPGLPPTTSTSWRIQERIKTVAAGLVLCLHVGVDPPDVIKTQPCARLECWCDPLSPGEAASTSEDGGTTRAIDVIGRNLVNQYEFWQPRARYKLLTDPTAEEVRKLALSLRKTAKEERALLHWNGHGTPRPTKAGELWVFNRQFTQYIPLPVADIIGWLGLPCTVVLDCSAAGLIYDSLLACLPQHQQNADGRALIILAACQSNEILPMAPELPADLFTACLTTPLEAAIRWHVLRCGPESRRAVGVSEILASIPGQLHDRKTVLGELHWIFTAITDTMAWLHYPRDTFKSLFRQDLLTASLFRNMLLATRIMRAYHCTPMSWPPLPVGSHSHRLWLVWDHVLDDVLAAGSSAKATGTIFAEQMDAFEAWLDERQLDSSAPWQSDGHLPLILQVLLSQSHRARALHLLVRHFDLGPDAAHDTLDVGVLPYVLKLLQSPCAEVRPVLLAMWTRLLAYDPTTQRDLAKDDGYMYFVRAAMDPEIPVFDRTLGLCCLAAFCEHSATPVRADGLPQLLMEDIMDHLATDAEGDPEPMLWSVLALSGLWAESLETKMALSSQGQHDLHSRLVVPLAQHPDWRLRAAACHFVASLISPEATDLPAILLDLEQDCMLHVAGVLLDDASEAVRLELIVCLSRWIEKHFNKFALAAYDMWGGGAAAEGPLQPVATGDIVRNPSLYSILWEAVLALAMDPAEPVARLAASIVDEIHMSFLFMQPAASSLSSAAGSKELLFVQNEGLPSRRSPSPPSELAQPMAKSASRLTLPSALPLPSRLVSHCLHDRIQQDIDEHQARLMTAAGFDRTPSSVVEEAALSRLLYECQGEQRFERQLALLAHGSLPTRLAFHPTRDRLIVSDARNRVTAWDWAANVKGSFFVNGNPERSSQICGLLALPQDRLLVASSDGVVRCWRPDFNEEQRPADLLAVHQLTTGGTASGKGGSSAVFEVDCVDHLCLGVASEDAHLRSWDLTAQRALCVAPLGQEASPTALRLSRHSAHEAFAGFASGNLSSYDIRAGRAVASVAAHEAWIVEVLEVPLGEHQLITASVLGELCILDRRQLGSALVRWDLLSGHAGLLTLAGHPRLPIIGLGTTDPALRFLALPAALDRLAAGGETPSSPSGTGSLVLNTIKYHDGLFGQRIGSPAASAFHPNRPIFALGSTDTVVALYESAGHSE